VLIPSHIIARKDLTPSEKMLYGRINGLTGDRGYCWAHNQWLGEQLDLGKDTVRHMIRKMTKMGLLRVEVLKTSTSEVLERKIFVLGIPPVHPTLDTPSEALNNDQVVIMQCRGGHHAMPRGVP
jgi:hypothetical protein